jgi:hypothetical protein
LVNFGMLYQENYGNAVAEASSFAGNSVTRLDKDLHKSADFESTQSGGNFCREFLLATVGTMG